MIAIIGDIHGCYNTLKNLIEKIREKYPSVQIYSVGDLVDRGKYSFEVIELIKSEKIIFTPGNHDYMFYYFVNYPLSQMGSSWLYNGYENTIASYENRFEKIAEHLELIINAPLFLNLTDCFISHAGISKYYESKLPKNFRDNLEVINDIVHNDITSPDGILWTRGELLDIGKLQVVGHTRKDDVKYQKSNNVVYIDTSIYAGNKLSAIIVNQNKIVDTISTPTVKIDLG